VKIIYQEPTPISDIHKSLMDQYMQAHNSDERTAWVETTIAARLATPIIRHGSGRVDTTDKWAKYRLPRSK